MKLNERIKIEQKNNSFNVVFNGTIIKKFDTIAYGEKVAWQLAATYREGYMDAIAGNTEQNKTDAMAEIGVEEKQYLGLSGLSGE